MREFKFRAWDSFKKRWVWHPSYWEFTDIGKFKARCPTDITLMQYIGLKDKKGKEIYEGDIIKHLKYGGVYKVEYTLDNTGYDLRGQENYHLSKLCERNIIVIGNIYENPELLKDGK